MKITDSTGRELMNVSELSRDGNTLVIKVKIFRALPVSVRLTPEEARNGLRLLDFKLLWFLLTFLLRSSGI
jgi:hypothetical protein